MKLTSSAITILAVTSASVSAFTAGPVRNYSKGPVSVAVQSSLSDALSLGSIESELKYEPGKAETTFAKRYGHLAGAKVKTVGESFASFTKELGYTVNALYKNMVTDIVGSTHLIVVNARFQKDAVWSLGLLTTLDLLLKNYPEQDVAKKITSALFVSCGLDEAEIRAEAKALEEWAQGKTRAEIEAALSGEDASSPLGKIAVAAKAEEFWMYSRYFGVGLLKIMEIVGLEMDKDEIYPVMENWMSEKLGKSHMTACNDSDLYFKIRSKLDMMETMMKEIEIREKKRMAERLEEKAEMALRAAEREEKMKAEIAAEAASRESVKTE